MPRWTPLSCVATVVVAAAGCASNWQTEPVAPAALLAGAGPSEVRVRKADGSYLYLRDPAVTHDSLVGWEAPDWDKAGTLSRRAIPLADVQAVAVRGNDVVVNVVLGFLAGTVAFGYLVIRPALAGD